LLIAKKNKIVNNIFVFSTATQTLWGKNSRPLLQAGGEVTMENT